MKTQNILPLGVLPVIADEEVADSNPIPVTMATPLLADVDTINVSKMSKGGVTVALDAISATTTSAEIDCRGFNTISVEMTASGISGGSATAAIHGCAVSGGSFGPCYSPKDDGTHVAQTTPTISSNGITTYYFRGIPNFVKIVATIMATCTLTCKITPMNL